MGAGQWLCDRKITLVVGQLGHGGRAIREQGAPFKFTIVAGPHGIYTLENLDLEELAETSV